LSKEKKKRKKERKEMARGLFSRAETPCWLCRARISGYLLQLKPVLGVSP
jgi:hypothetical protein